MELSSESHALFLVAKRLSPGKKLKKFLIIKMLQQQCLSGRDCRNPEYKDVFGARYPWHLDLGNPCRE
ncbi:MAG: hypothetical protein KGZ88_01000 [Methylomicrobium sp.]|nr:hypothetical protein [Methylomicrobium sp.]